jgi:hypothetical protein
MGRANVVLGSVGAVLFVLGFCLDIVAAISADYNEPTAFVAGGMVANGVWLFLSAAK